MAKVALSRATLANWVIRSAEDWLMPLVDCMHAELLKQPVIHANETPVQVLKEKGRKNKTKSYMWVYTNGEFVQDVRFGFTNITPAETAVLPENFSKGMREFCKQTAMPVMSRFPARLKLSVGYTPRRYFVDAIPAGISPEETAESISGQAIRKINELFALDKELSHKSVGERQAERLRLEKDKLEAFFVWLEEIQSKALPKSALGKAVNYALNHRNGLSAFLTDGNIALSNNICERAIRNFTIGRKNWLFSASPKGATASAAVYSIVETSKANSLEPFRYLTYLLEKLPNINFKIHPEVLEDFLPWSKKVQQKCK